MDHPRLTFFREFFRRFSHSPSGRVAELIKTALGAQIRSRTPTALQKALDERGLSDKHF